MALTLFNKYVVGGVTVHDLNYEDIFTITKDSFDSPRPLLFFSMNGEGIANYSVNLEFKALVDESDYIHADGWSTMMAGRLFTKGKYSVRLATTDCYRNILEACLTFNKSVFFLGSKEEFLSKTVSNVKKEFTDIKVAGYQNGYFDNEIDVINKINESGASVVFVGLGRPKQESFALKIREQCPNVKLVKTCGGLFDFLSGKNKRAPLYLQRYGLEWAYRLYNEPKRLFFRYFWTNFYSLYLYTFKSHN